ncbi:hypothetical protein BK784_08825 [Bacillus thuringiensis serovar medellin]|uniref:Uncharacterized protein n=1 Tax=Bacillus thuringiensis subsp. medellin TaxID=79672 RepID=A0A9X6N5A1_BACTV|nr:hypothetical protein [Bacillus thuringiensis]OUC02589.1 hypothetical protein BK784_08825 [Bacillus thuringiensis serovar medellin]
MNRGRPQKYTDKDLKEVLVKVVSKNPGRKITPSYLEDFTGIKRHVWTRRMKGVIEQLNQPTHISSEGEALLPLPNIFQLVENNWENKTDLIKSLSHFNETLQYLYEQAKLYQKEKSENKLLKREIKKKDDKIRELDRELTYYKDLYFKMAVKGSYKSHRDEEGLKNVISISANKHKGLDVDFTSAFPELFDDGEIEEDKK